MLNLPPFTNFSDTPSFRPTVKSLTDIASYAREAMRSKVYLGVNFLITTVTIITGATGSYTEFSWQAHAIIHYTLMLYYIGFIYALAPRALYYGVRANVPIVFIITALYTTASFPDAFIQHMLLKQNGAAMVVGEMFETATILVPGIIMFLLYLGDDIVDGISQPGARCAIWWSLSNDDRPQESRCPDAAGPGSDETEAPELIGEILMLQAQNQYTQVTFSDHEALVRMPLTKVIEAIDQSKGWRVHRSYWVRKSQIKAVKYVEGNPRLYTQEDIEVPVSRKMATDIKGYLEVQPDKAA